MKVSIVDIPCSAPLKVRCYIDFIGVVASANALGGAGKTFGTPSARERS